MFSDVIDMGKYPFSDSMDTPIFIRGSIMRFMGLLDKDLSPVNFAVTPFPARSPANRRTVVPELPQFNGNLGGLRSLPFKITVVPFLSLLIP